ncbi:pancreatic triacylglycerol lipase-like [Odontomachus brunneus]|uniref:pancreatic triacylglycerol lipase-like n=1 Tax=Odontomachus brunneus TaxID=486640 RepID=UPI0013F1BB52|nr:pancreatic triacylglycerol lipase-like [Odontomachus brunneus]XP_032675760.1 pancreatic triacylglycerol lipase-like [Odontomachus brunneus]
MQPADVLRCVLLALLVIIIVPSIHGKLQPAKLLVTRNRAMLRRIAVSREEKSKVCYDLVGCFAVPPSHLSIKRPPEHPNVIQTKFFLYTRANRQNPELLEYGDNLKSILHSHFNTSNPLKVMIHGFKGSGSDVSVILSVNLLLDIEDVNIIIPDWTKGAGSTYGAAVANSELVGRQLALIFLDTINIGISPVNIHVIGFSLGAHVAGCASEVLKNKNLLLGRITGLDPASPFFRHHLFREKSRKLDATDASLVDVIHTDGSQVFTDGFGLLKPIGHIDFFPNGGREQPGCVDIKNSVVVSHLKEDLVDRDIACSHLRAWYFFVESIRSQNEKCKFVAWPCPQGGMSYIRGMCFPMETTEWNQEMGYAANRGPLGIYYLATRAESPFCGKPLRASVMTSEGMPKTSGILSLKIFLGNSTTFFKIQCTLPKRRNEWMMFYNIAAVTFDALLTDTMSITGMISYQRTGNKTEENAAEDLDADVILFNKLAIEDRKGNRWEYCKMNTAINSHEVYVELRSERCTSL